MGEGQDWVEGVAVQFVVSLWCEYVSSVRCLLEVGEICWYKLLKCEAGRAELFLFVCGGWCCCVELGAKDGEVGLYWVYLSFLVFILYTVHVNVQKHNVQN